jgi:hypothetical protein
MGRKSRRKKERRQAIEAPRRDLVAERGASAQASVLSQVAAADPGPHPLLPARLHARRRELRDRLATNSVSLRTSVGLLAELAGGVQSERALDLDFEVLHDLDARIAWEALLAAQDAKPTAVPDEELCQVVADCAPVERGAELDPLLGGTWCVSQDLVDRLNATSSPEGSPEQAAAEFAETEQFVGSRYGEPARSLLRFVAAETTLHYQYPEGSWPAVEDLPGGLSDQEGAVGSWAAAEGIGRTAAVALAARMAPVLSELSRTRFARPAG